MKTSRLIRNNWLWLALLLAVVGLGCAGCGGPEAQNTSSRPWNSPEGWQYGSFPSQINRDH
jgi:hypothetical protein